MDRFLEHQLFLLIERRDVKNAKILLENELFNRDSINQGLYLAVSSFDKLMVKLLLVKGADPNLLFGSLQRTPLLQAVWHDLYDIAKLLLEYGANPYMMDRYNQIPLDFARRYRDQKL